MYSVDGGTLALLHFSGADASTTITDEIPANIWTAVGNAQIDTAQYKAVASSLLLDGTGDYITTPDADKWAFTGDVTIDFWVRYNALPSAGEVVQFIGQYVDNSNRWSVGLNNAVGILYLGISDTGGTLSAYTSTSVSLSISTNTWYHYAVVRSGTTWKIFIDGISQTLESNVDGAITNLASVLAVGGRNAGTPDRFLNGWLAEYRISNVARYTGNFYPDTYDIYPLTYSEIDTNLSYDALDTTLTYKPIDTLLTYEEQNG